MCLSRCLVLFGPWSSRTPSFAGKRETKEGKVFICSQGLFVALKHFHAAINMFVFKEPQDSWFLPLLSSLHFFCRAVLQKSLPVTSLTACEKLYKHKAESLHTSLKCSLCLGWREATVLTAMLVQLMMWDAIDKDYHKPWSRWGPL